MGIPMKKIQALFGRTTVVLVLLVMMLAVAQACQPNPSSAGASATPAPTPAPRQQPRPAAAPSEAVTVSNVAVAVPISFTGEVRAKEMVTVQSRTAGRIAEIKVAVGDQVKKGDLLVVLEHETLDAQVKQEEARLASAESSLKSAQAQLDLLRGGATKEQIAVTEADLKAAEANMALQLAGATKEQIAGAEADLAAAQAPLDALMAGARPEQIKISELQVKIAEAGAVNADIQAAVHRLPYSSERFEIYDRYYEQQVLLAQMQVDLTKNQLELLKAPPRTEDVAKLKAAVDNAKAKLEALKAAPRSQQVLQLQAAVDKAKAQLELLKATARPEQLADLQAKLEGAKAQVSLSQASLSLAKAQRDEAFLYSPFDGVVSARSVSAGSLASTSTAIVTVANKEVELVTSVDGITLGQVSPGQVVSISLPLYPDQVFSGKVRAIAPVASSATRMFEVYVDPQDQGSLLRPGMFASMSVSVKK